MEREELRLALKDYVEERDVIFKSGKKGNVYAWIKKAYGEPDLLNAMADYVGELIPKEVTCVVGYGKGGDALASTISSRKGLKLTLLREEKKDHGLGDRIEHYVPTEKDIIAIVDDVYNSGTSSRETEEILKENPAKIQGIYVVVNRGDEVPDNLRWVFILEELVH